MVGVEFFGNVDLASVAIWLFWIFFAGLVIYLQTENMREGYPLRGDDDETPANESLWPVPKPKTFQLRDGRGELTVPSNDYEESKMRRDLALAPSSAASGSPWIPTGDPMVDGVGPAAWAPRRDAPELDAHGHVKIQPMSKLEDFKVSAGRDPRGKAVVGGDGEVVGRVIDMWVDVPEQMVRFLTVDLNPEGSGKTRLIPMNMAKIGTDRVTVRSLYAHNWDGVPATKKADEVTLLEEDKIMAYYAGGTLYATPARSGTVL
ncbi:photosynthetic reaction center subunit H [Yoonia sediminilitoris]|uniref:Photosynthetic reaction center H subunit n=1 Tax=Yoonia sediminilitoris TaxID=1286148 RepID=A0A2T6KMM1_9RHOB|nr:photosynthetic reaction center subunit H [Yoonia sediminilitoris]PUB17424.1 photosynthetic reaction center H subunit [Yoonia sediminilitoris]RCW97719.1 photosynthetic reaction center H subunit [Yoonia sediminilitoris]